MVSAENPEIGGEMADQYRFIGKAGLQGKPISETTAEQAATAALAGARPLRMNAYKVKIATTLIQRAILS